MTESYEAKKDRFLKEHPAFHDWTPGFALEEFVSFLNSEKAQEEKPRRSAFGCCDECFGNNATCTKPLCKCHILLCAKQEKKECCDTLREARCCKDAGHSGQHYDATKNIWWDDIAHSPAPEKPCWNCRLGCTCLAGESVSNGTPCPCHSPAPEKELEPNHL